MTFRLIAHRGGVVDTQHPEHSPGGLAEAARRGYTMIEIDVRRSKDSVAVAHHNADFQAYYGDERRVEDLLWQDIASLRATTGGHRPRTFDEVVANCAALGLQVMLDTKVVAEQDFYDGLAATLDAHGLLQSALLIGTPSSKEYLSNRARMGVNLAWLEKHGVTAQPSSAHKASLDNLFLFRHGRDLTPDVVALAQSLGMLIVPSVNIFHYADLADHLAAAHADIERLQAAGIIWFQIDSVYDPFFQ